MTSGNKYMLFNIILQKAILKLYKGPLDILFSLLQ